MSEAKARANDPETSWEAAETVNVPRDKRAVLVALYMLGTASDEDIFYEVSYSAFEGKYIHAGTAQSLRSRRAELMRDGYIENPTYDDGTPMYGETACHRRCRVYKLTVKGRELAKAIF